MASEMLNFRLRFTQRRVGSRVVPSNISSLSHTQLNSSSYNSIHVSKFSHFLLEIILAPSHKSNSHQPPSPYSWNREIIQWQIISSFFHWFEEHRKINSVPSFFLIFWLAYTLIGWGERGVEKIKIKNKANPLQTNFAVHENRLNSLFTTWWQQKSSPQQKARVFQTTTTWREKCDVDWDRVHPVSTLLIVRMEWSREEIWGQIFMQRYC